MPDKATLAVFPGGPGSVTLPEGYGPAWGAVKAAGPVAHPATMYGIIAAGRSNMVAPQGRYLLLGEGSVRDLDRIGGAAGKANYATFQMRHDGWFYVNAAQAGTWTMNQNVDDYFGFYIDGRQVLFNETYVTGVSGATCEVAEGWHRFTTIAGDTAGGWGARYAFGNDYVPFTITVNGSTHILSDDATFPKGSGASAIRLAADADWSAFGTVALKDGSTLDLNGHRLTVRDIVCDDYLGVCITNTAAKKAVLLFTGEPTESKAYSDGAIKEVNSKILLAKAGERAAIWTGAAGDGNALDENNWQDMLTEEPVVPTAGHAVKIIDGSTVALQIPSGSPFVCKSFDVGSCTFTDDCDWTGLAVTPRLGGAADLGGANASGAGRYVLNGGELKVRQISGGSGRATFSMNGGTLFAKANGTLLSNIGSVVLGTGGKIDTAGFNASGAGGGFTALPGSTFEKTGAGTLTLPAVPPADTVAVSRDADGFTASFAAPDTRLFLLSDE